MKKYLSGLEKILSSSEMVGYFSTKRLVSEKGFSLTEILASLIIGSMVLVAVLTVYSRIRGGVDTVQRHLGKRRLPREILQLIAEDLDRMAVSGEDTRVLIENKIINGYPAARLEIRKFINEAESEKKQEFETVVWLSIYDYESDANGLVLYRKHSGMAVEDKLLDEQRADWEQAYPYVPICGGVTYFSVKIPKGDKFASNWEGEALPPAVVVELSFAEPYESLEGTLEVPELQKFERTIALVRTRKLQFKFVPDQNILVNEDLLDLLGDMNDVNDLVFGEDVNDFEGLEDTGPVD
jgi:prepilin-type N-terminal cleavage/methylation domain-containing protein